MSSRKELDAAATRLLQERGFTWSGLPKSAVSGDQTAFERKLIFTPVNGKVGYARRIRRR